MVRVNAKEGPDHSVPHLPLELRIDEVAAIEGPPEGHGSDVGSVGAELVRHQPSLGGSRLSDAVGDDGHGIPISAKPRLAQPRPIVDDHHAPFGHLMRSRPPPPPSISSQIRHLSPPTVAPPIEAHENRRKRGRLKLKTDPVLLEPNYL